jgi:hypothetical protein
MASKQRRIDDLLRLKTRGLIYQNVDGTYPEQGSVAYITSDISGNIGFSGITIDASNNVVIPGNLTVKGITNFATQNADRQLNSTALEFVPANRNVDNNISTSSSALNISGELHVSSNSYIQGTLSAGATTLSDVSVSGVTTLTDVSVSGATILSDLTILGTLTFTGATGLTDISVSGKLDAGAATLTAAIVSGDLDAGATTLASVNVTGATTLTTADVTGDTTIGGTLGVTGATTLTTADVTGDTTIGGTLGVTGDITVNGNIVVNANGTISGTVQTNCLTLPDQQGVGTSSSLYLDSYVWNQNNRLNWQNNDGSIEPLSGWSEIMDPSGCEIPTIIPGKVTLSKLAYAFNKLVYQLASRGAFCTVATPSYPDIKFNTTQGMLLDGLHTLTIPKQSISLDSLVSELNTQVDGLSFKFITSLNASGQYTVTFISGAAPYVITDLPGQPGSAYTLMNHLGITLPPYPNTTFSTGFVGAPIPAGGIGSPPALPIGSVESVHVDFVKITTTSLTLDIGGIPNEAVALAITIQNTAGSQSPVTHAIIPVFTTSLVIPYGSAGLVSGNTYSIGVTPLSLYDAGPIAMVNVTLT